MFIRKPDDVETLPVTPEAKAAIKDIATKIFAVDAEATIVVNGMVKGEIDRYVFVDCLFHLAGILFQSGKRVNPNGELI